MYITKTGYHTLVEYLQDLRFPKVLGELLLDYLECDLLKESKKILAKYPDRVPMIIEKVSNSDVPDIDYVKFLVPSDLTYGQFLYTIRARLKLSPEKTMYILINNTIQPCNTLMSELYIKHQECGFLFCQYGSC